MTSGAGCPVFKMNYIRALTQRRQFQVGLGVRSAPAFYLWSFGVVSTALLSNSPHMWAVRTSLRAMHWREARTAAIDLSIKKRESDRRSKLTSTLFWVWFESFSLSAHLDRVSASNQ